jgi:hypothetical protein
MMKYKMIQDETCPRCHSTETTKHLLFKCNQVAKIWKIFNTLMTDVKQGENKVEHYDDVYKSCGNPASSLLKIKVIQSLIQIQRPSNWTRNNLLEILKEIKNIEKYNSLKNRTREKFERKWKPFNDIHNHNGNLPKQTNGKLPNKRKGKLPFNSFFPSCLLKSVSCLFCYPRIIIFKIN